MLTMQDIAKLAGLSRYTVSKVLNGDTSVKEALRKKVLDVCERNGYIPDRNAISLVKGGTSLVGVLVPYITDDFYSGFIQTFDRAAAERGRQAVYRSTYNDSATEAEALKNFLSLKVCAMVVAPVVESPDLRVHELAARNVPVVYFDRPLDKSSFQVVNDNRAGVLRMTEALLAKGRKPAYLGSFYKDSNPTAKERERGYRDAMAARKLEPLTLDVSGSFERQDNERFGYGVVQRALASGLRFDSLLCVTDSAALGAMRALQEAGLKPGSDVLVAGHDDLKFAAFTSPSLTTVRQRSDLFAAKCMELIDKLLSGETPSRKRFVIAPEIVVRESA